MPAQRTTKSTTPPLHGAISYPAPLSQSAPLERHRITPYSRTIPSGVDPSISSQLCVKPTATADHPFLDRIASFYNQQSSVGQGGYWYPAPLHPSSKPILYDHVFEPRMDVFSFPDRLIAVIDLPSVSVVNFKMRGRSLLITGDQVIPSAPSHDRPAEGGFWPGRRFRKILTLPRWFMGNVPMCMEDGALYLTIPKPQTYPTTIAVGMRNDT